MNSENIKNNDPLQLKQMIIFLKAELTKYEHKVKQYKDSYHYSVIENLEQENAQLIKEKNELTKKLNEAQRNRHFISVDTAWKTKTDWLPVNKQLNDVMKKLKDDAGTNHKRYRKQERQITSLHKKFIEQKSGLEQFEYRFVDLFQKATNQVHTQIKNANITNEERLRFEDGRRRLLKKIEEKNNKIEELKLEIIDLKEQQKISEDSIVTTVLKSESAKTSELLLQLERQMKEGLAKSLDSEGKWEAQLAVFDEMKQRFLKEIDEKNNKIEELQLEIVDMKKQKELSEENVLVAVLKTELAGTSEALLQLEQQMREGIIKSMDSEEKWKAQLAVFDEMKQRFLKEIDEKNNKIEELQLEIVDMKKQKELSEDNILATVLKTELAGTSEALLQLEQQMREGIIKSMDSEEKWEAKLAVFDEMKQRFLKEIDEKNNKIEELQLEIKDMKKQKELSEDNIVATVLKTELAGTSELLLQLERQMSEVLAKSLDSEEKLNTKLDVFKDVRQRLLNEVEEKNNKIKEMQYEIAESKEQIEMAVFNTPTGESQPTSTSETLLLLERQIKEVLAKSLDYEVKLDAKLDVLNTMENKLDQLTGEIDDIKDLGSADENIN